MSVSGAGLDILKDIARRAMRERHLEPEFSPEAVREVERIGPAATGAGAGIRDLRGLLWASIDNDDSRDLDQLSVAEPLPGDGIKVWVAVADVDALVSRGSAIDAHARVNTTSVYTVAQIFPMLPEKLSTDLTSLAEERERLAIIIEMTVGAAGDITASDVYRGVVVNRAKLAYDSVAAWLKGTGSAPSRLAAVPGLEQQLRMQDQAAQRLRRVRHAHGALSLASSEAHAVLEGDVLRDLRPEESNRAKELIEDFMIAANGVTARYLARRGLPSLRRVLRTPERWGRIAELATEHGDRLPSVANAQALNQFLLRCQRADPAHFPDLCLAVIKLLGRGEYVLQLPGEAVEGHFGLAVSDYTHATAPN
ncbi:MAG: ribonuclease catalytic domain-containing protein, partial [Rhizomicrobium sp.]